jgi:hypothetical protein
MYSIDQSEIMFSMAIRLNSAQLHRPVMPSKLDDLSLEYVPCTFNN